MQVPAAGHQRTEVLAAVLVEGHDLAVEDDVTHPELLANPITELVEPMEDVPTLRLELALSA
jgi:hypothetical protein